MFSESILNGNECTNCLKKCSMFHHLSIEEMKYIDNSRYEAKFKAGEIIFKQGSPTSHIVSFSIGLAKLYMETQNQRDVIISLVQPTTLVGGPGIYIDGRHKYSLASLVDSVVCFIDIKPFKELIRANPNFAEAMIEDISIKDYRLMQRLANMTIKQSHGRMAEILLYLSMNIFKKTEFDIVLSRQELADLTGMSKEGAIRILKEFKSDGLIDCENQIFRIQDIKRLEEISLNG
jgi:CRP/FNR family transcriptional regulator, polysaccharide utilization system transcription regulator